MKRKIALLLFAVLLCCHAGVLSACAAYMDGAATTGNAFVQKLVDRDYAAAYEYVYVLTPDVKTKSDFGERFRNIYDALQITDIQLLSRDITQKDGEQNEYLLTYSLQMQSGILGTVTYDYSADIVATPLGYTVLYTPSLILPSLEEGDKVRVTNRQGARGEIFSSDGKLLAQNSFAQCIYIDLEKDPDIEQVKGLLASLFGADPAQIQKKYDNAVEKEYPLEVLLSFPRDTVTLAEKEQIEAVNGLGIDDERLSPSRYYPFSDNTAHMIGYMGSPSEEQLAQNADAGITAYSIVGKTGIESAYEETLRGTDGRVIYIENDKGEVKETLYEEPHEDGSDITLTIDSKAQNAAYTLLAANCAEDQSGVVIAMHYDTGEVEAMVSYPSFDSNLFNFPVKEEVYAYYTADENQDPLFARATQALYMPGSTFKPFSSIPAIRAGWLQDDYSPEITLEPLTTREGDRWTPSEDGFPCYTPIYRYETPEAFTYTIAMKSSDNIYFAYVALQTDMEPFLAYMREIGMGEKPDFELPLATSNAIEADPAGDDNSNYHMLAQAGYGTGEVQMTPVQMASLYTAITNDGDIVNPTIVDKVSRSVDDVEAVEWENSRTIFKENIMDQKAIGMIQTALRRVVQDGTVYAANLQDVPGLLAKTGTAQMGTQDNIEREINWVVALNPNNKMLYLVLLETDLDEGTERKLAILHGLVKSENYDAAVQMQIPELEEEPAAPEDGADGGQPEGDTLEDGDGQPEE
ncbi:MAG TPA: hypothetical protein DEB31_11460 [Clostridiales bacterium]|nr:hypothetical protein [Clostridiales bacterium]